MSDPQTPDPVFVNARRETIVIVVCFFGLMIWSAGTCYWYGYNVKPTDIRIIWGMPEWVFRGIFLPWIAANLIAFWFCFWFMVDDDLGEGETAE